MADGRRIVVLGGGTGGLLAALILARAGHEVTVLERDPEPPPQDAEEAWATWLRRGVPQFRQPHGLPVRFTQVLDSELPALAQQVRAVALTTSLADSAPEPEALTPEEQAYELSLLRRTTLEHLVASEAAADPRVDVQRGRAATGLLTGDPIDGRLQVVGVQTEAGPVEADLVVDSSGRRTAVGGWLAELGSPVETTSESDGFTYASRWFRLAGEPPPLRARTFGGIGPGIMGLIFPADGNVVGIALVGSAQDELFRGLRRPDAFMAVSRALPLVAEWLDDVEPLTEVMPMGSIQNRMLRLRTDATTSPVGIINTSDAFVSSNPSLGRGLGISADMAVRLRDHLDQDPDPVGLVDGWDAIQQRWHRPWYDDSVASDANFRSALHRLRGEDSVEPPHAWRSHLGSAAMVDTDCWRVTTRVNQILASPTEWTADTELLARAEALAAEAGPPPEPAFSR